jgi:predicted nucleic acid-binding protein
MIATSTGYWMAFFDPENPNHEKARSDIRIFDREKIVLSEFVLAEVASWLLKNNKQKHKNWFLDYAQNTANTRIFHFGKEEFGQVAKICMEKDVAISEASLEYLQTQLNLDVTGY